MYNPTLSGRPTVTARYSLLFDELLRQLLDPTARRRRRPVSGRGQEIDDRIGWLDVAPIASAVAGEWRCGCSSVSSGAGRWPSMARSGSRRGSPVDFVVAGMGIGALLVVVGFAVRDLGPHIGGRGAENRREQSEFATRRDQLIITIWFALSAAGGVI